MINPQDTINFDPITDDSAILQLKEKNQNDYNQVDRAATLLAEIFVGLIDEIAIQERVGKSEKGLESKAFMPAPFGDYTRHN